MYCSWLEEVDPQGDVFKEHLLGLLDFPLLSTNHEVNNLLYPVLLLTTGTLPWGCWTMTELLEAVRSF